MKKNEVMKWLLTSALTGTLLLGLAVGPSIAAPPPPAAQLPAAAAPPAPAKDAMNYVVHVKWVDGKGTTNQLRVLTTEGSFSLESMQPGVKINNSEVPITLRFNGTLTALGPDKGRLQLFLGRTVPYVTSTVMGQGGATSSSYQQMQVGLSSTFVVTFGKPLVIQADGNEEITLLVKREE
jgi:hypothetical protein